MKKDEIRNLIEIYGLLFILAVIVAEILCFILGVTAWVSAALAAWGIAVLVMTRILIGTVK